MIKFKTSAPYFFFFLLLSVILAAGSCKKKEATPLVTTDPVINSLKDPKLSDFPLMSVYYEEVKFLITPPKTLSSGAFTYKIAGTGTSVASVDAATGLVTLKAPGSVIITANQAAKNEYKAASLSTFLDVKIKTGTSYGGGIVVKVEPNEMHGLIAATIDIGPANGSPWSDLDSSPPLIGNTDASHGALNTAEIIKKQGNTGTYAAKLCKEYKGGGYDDWFLPALNELVCLNVTSPSTYWSSSEIDLNNSYTISFPYSASSLQSFNKQFPLQVRSFRAF